MRFGLHRFFVAVLFILFCLGFSRDSFAWPFSSKDPGAQKSQTQNSPVPQAPKPSLPPPRVSAVTTKHEDLSVIPDLSNAKVPSAITSGTVRPVSPVAVVQQDPDISKIQKQIQEIIKVNESLKSHYASQAAEIQKISEQARIHQRILKDLEAGGTRPVAAKVTPENFMNREKVKLIEQETNKNNQFLNNLKNNDPSRKTQPVPQEAKTQQA